MLLGHDGQDVTESPSIGFPRWVHTSASVLTSGPRRSTKPSALVGTAAFVAGGALVIWSATIHLDLWNDGYQNIPTIGNLFLAQCIGGLVVGLLIIGVRQLWTALLGAGFAVMTMAGFLVSVYAGLFGFSDSWSAPFAEEAFAIECAVLSLMLLAGSLCVFAAMPLRSGTPGTRTRAPN